MSTILASNDLKKKLYKPENKKTINSFKSARNYEECDCDSTLLYSLIRNTCTKKLDPTSGWGLEELPPDTYVEVGDDIERIRLSKNVFSHKKIKELEDQIYKKYYRIARKICQRLKHYSQGGDYEEELQQIHESKIEDVKGVSKKVDKLAGKHTLVK
ncbi:hypothetical protein MHBO_004025 [Bonamia ostreae]|uniref:DZIP3-like HEPN domain-containing protein n=1 Tax=Bonamia ostreae TaxID=126728 RepID=A0ABV2AS59_9EUKA